MEDKKKAPGKTVYIAAILGVTIGLLWQFGGVLLKEGPVADTLKKVRGAAPVITSWEYKELRDKATNTPVKTAALNSINTANTGFGPTSRMQLILLECNNQKNIAVASPGVPLCASSPEQCSVTLTFDGGSAEKVAAGYAKNSIILEEPEKLFKRIKSTKNLSVETTYVSGSKGKFPCRFNFNTAGLTWN